MHLYSHLFLSAWVLLSSFGSVICESVQFVHSSGVGLALSIIQNGITTDALFQITAPTAHGWGAIGTGDRMDRSLMFILYPATNSQDVTVSIRTSKGHDTPAPLSGNDILVQSSEVTGSTMTANLIWYNCSVENRARALDVMSSTQPWIWAVGPGEHIASDAQDADFTKHDSYGAFFTDMTKAQTTSSTVPQISGTINIGTTPLPSSVAVLVIIHAICLGGAFVLVFPLGVVILRWWGSFKIHWMVQLFGTLASITGLVVAIAFSIMDPEYRSLGETHQILGIIVVAGLLIQVLVGYSHHVQFKKVGRINWISHVHLWLGRGLIVFGMINAVLGCILSDYSTIGIGVGVISLLILVGTTIIVLWGNRRRRSKLGESSNSPSGYLLDDTRGPMRSGRHSEENSARPSDEWNGR